MVDYDRNNKNVCKAKDRYKKVALSCAAPREREASVQERWQGMEARGDKTDNLNGIPRFYMVEGKN